MIQLFQFRKPQILFTFNLKKKYRRKGSFNPLKNLSKSQLILIERTSSLKFLDFFLNKKNKSLFFAIELSINSD